MASLIRHLRAGSDSGAELVEFALAFPVLLLLFAGMADFALLFRTYQVATNAAREGARLAVLQGYDANSFAVPKARAVNYMVTALGATACTGTCTATATVVSIPIDPSATPPKNANGVQITVAYNYQFLYIRPIVRLIGGSGWSSGLAYTASAVMRNEIQGIN
jgi:Flp pilus assembly protein TadG